VDVINSLDADIVAVVGDRVDDTVEELGAAAPLRGIRAWHGAYFVTGNHEYGAYGDAPDFPRTFAGRDPSRPVVPMAHQPVQAMEAAQYGIGSGGH
jgi:predicted MPP superfamily phosphohydrolase